MNQIDLDNLTRMNLDLKNQTVALQANVRTYSHNEPNDRILFRNSLDARLDCASRGSFGTDADDAAAYGSSWPSGRPGRIARVSITIDHGRQSFDSSKNRPRTTSMDVSPDDPVAAASTQRVSIITIVTGQPTHSPRDSQNQRMSIIVDTTSSKKRPLEIRNVSRALTIPEIEIIKDQNKVKTFKKTSRTAVSTVMKQNQWKILTLAAIIVLVVGFFFYVNTGSPSMESTISNHKIENTGVYEMKTKQDCNLSRAVHSINSNIDNILSKITDVETKLQSAINKISSLEKTIQEKNVQLHDFTQTQKQLNTNFKVFITTKPQLNFTDSHQTQNHQPVKNNDEDITKQINKLVEKAEEDAKKAKQDAEKAKQYKKEAEKEAKKSKSDKNKQFWIRALALCFSFVALVALCFHIYCPHCCGKQSECAGAAATLSILVTTLINTQRLFG